jgi:folate-dependent phosphoribosylglycinamide formyltransferase PurN
MSGGNDYVLGSVICASAHAPAIIDAMAESIVDLLMRLAEVEQERDFYKAAAEKLMQSKPHNGRRKK